MKRHKEKEGRGNVPCVQEVLHVPKRKETIGVLSKDAFSLCAAAGFAMLALM